MVLQDAYLDDFVVLTLKAQEKNASEKCRLLKSSAANNCLTLLTNLSIEANRVDPDQTLIWVNTVCHRGFSIISAGEKSRRLLLRLAL